MKYFPRLNRANLFYIHVKMASVDLYLRRLALAAKTFLLRVAVFLVQKILNREADWYFSCDLALAVLKLFF